MADSKLAGLYVEFSSKGWAAVDAATKGLIAGLDKAKSAAANVAGGIASITGAALGLVSTGGGLGAFFASLSQGTMEGERMARAFDYLKRVVVDSFAGPMRAFTDNIIQLANWFRSLDQATKDWIARIGIIAVIVGTVGGVVAALAGGFAAIVAGATALAGVLGAVGSAILSVGWPAVLASVVALGAAFAVLAPLVRAWWQDLTKGATTSEEVAVRVVTAFLNAWTYVKAGASAAWAFISEITSSILWPVMQQTGEFVIAVFKNIWEVASTIWNAVGDVVTTVLGGIAKAMYALGLISDATFGGMAQAALDLATKLGRLMGLNLADMVLPKLPSLDDTVEAFGRAGKAGGDAWRQGMGDLAGNAARAKGIVDQFKGLFQGGGGGFRMKIDVQLESNQGLFDRLAKAFGSVGGSNIPEQQLNALQAIQGATEKAAAGIGELGNLLPAVN